MSKILGRMENFPPTVKRISNSATQLRKKKWDTKKERQDPKENGEKRDWNKEKKSKRGRKREKKKKKKKKENGPMVGVVCTTSPIFNLYKMVVFPPLSKPNITIRCSLPFPLSPDINLESPFPITEPEISFSNKREKEKHKKNKKKNNPTNKKKTAQKEISERKLVPKKISQKPGWTSDYATSASDGGIHGILPVQTAKSDFLVFFGFFFGSVFAAFSFCSVDKIFCRERRETLFFSSDLWVVGGVLRSM